jgi:hypothetical protein
MLYWFLGFFVFRQTDYPELTFIFNCIGAVVLAKPIWNVYMGKESKFIPKPVARLFITSMLLVMAAVLAVKLSH